MSMTIKQAFQKLTAEIGANLRNPFFVGRALHRACADIADNIVDAGSEVSVTQIQSTGTKIATVTVDSTATDLYAPLAVVTQTVASGTEIAEVDGTKIYIPDLGSVSVTADGVKTASEMFDDLFALVDMSKVTNNTKLTTNNGLGIFILTAKDANSLTFHGGSLQYFNRIDLKSSESKMRRFQCSTGTDTDYSANVRPDGEIISLIY